MSVLRVENLRYVYNEGLPTEKVALDNISFSVEKGDFIGVIGHTGSGKSTLVQHFNGLLKPTQGRIFIDERDIWQEKAKLKEFRFKVGLVFQYPEYQLFEETVRKDVAFGPKNMGLSAGDIEERVVEALGFVGIEPDSFDKSPFDLSGGQRRRVAIAGVLAMKPEILVLDEPAAGLDPHGRAEILGKIKDYHESTGTTVIIVSHSMEDIAKYTKKVMVINRGGLFDFDETKKVFAKSCQLTEMGLSIPMITQIMLRLRERGYDVDPSIYTAEDAARNIMDLLGKGDGNA